MSGILSRRRSLNDMPVVSDPTLIFNTAENYTAAANTPSGSSVQADGSLDFDTVNKGTNATNTVETTFAATGTRSFKHTTPASAVSSYNAWYTNVTNNSVPVYCSAQFYLPSLLSIDNVAIGIRHADNTNLLSARLTSGNKFELVPATAYASSILSTTSVPSGAWFGIKLAITTLGNGTTTGRGILQIFTGGNWTTPVETITKTDLALGTTAPGRYTFGLFNTVSSKTIYVDNPRKANGGFPSFF